VPGLAPWSIGVTLITLGDCEQNLHHWDEAIAALEESVRLLAVPDAPRRYHASAIALLSIALWDSRRDRPRALRLAEEAAAMFALQAAAVEELHSDATARPLVIGDSCAARHAESRRHRLESSSRP
jgi:hypothetical protein